MVVTKRWRGMRWTQAVSKDERYRCGRQSRVVLAPDAGVKFAGRARRRRWQTSPITGLLALQALGRGPSAGSRSSTHRMTTGIPLLAAGNHDVEDDDQLAHACDQRDLL